MATATKAILFRQCMTKEEYAVFRKIRRGYWNAVPPQDFAIAKRLVERSFLMRSGDAPQQFAWGPKAWQIYEGKGRAALKRGRPQAKMDGSKQAAGGRSVGRKRAKPDDSTYLGRFAVRLNERMKRQRLSVKELADKLGVSETTVYDWLAARKEPNMDRYPALAQALGYKKPGDVLPLE